MSCHRVRRELLWMMRFSEFGPDSEEHLDHLAGCRTCRDEVGYDRAMVRQLRAALAARVEGIEPSSGVWEQVRVQAQQPERGRFPWPWRRQLDPLGLRRSLTAMAGTGLALVLALNMEVVPVGAPGGGSPSPSAVLAAATGVPSGWDRTPRVVTDPRTGLTTLAPAQPDPEGLVDSVDATQVHAQQAASEQPARQQVPDGIMIVLRLPIAPDLSADDAAAVRTATDDDPGSAEEPAPAPEPVESPAGQPT